MDSDIGFTAKFLEVFKITYGDLSLPALQPAFLTLEASFQTSTQGSTPVLILAAPGWMDGYWGNNGTDCCLFNHSPADAFWTASVCRFHKHAAVNILFI